MTLYQDLYEKNHIDIWVQKEKLGEFINTFAKGCPCTVYIVASNITFTIKKKVSNICIFYVPFDSKSYRIFEKDEGMFFLLDKNKYNSHVIRQLKEKRCFYINEI